MSVSINEASEIVKIVALVIGGFWAIWTFQKLQRVRAAESQIETARIQQEEVKARLHRQQPQLALSLNVSEEPSPTETYISLLCVKVTVKNEGDENLRLILNPFALTVAQLLFESDGSQKIGQVQRYGASHFVPDRDEPEMFSERIIRAGQTRQMALAVLPVAAPTIYIIQFDVLYLREPFDAQLDEVPSKKPLTINAVEQTFYVATGKRSTPTLATAA